MFRESHNQAYNKNGNQQLDWQRLITRSGLAFLILSPPAFQAEDNKQSDEPCRSFGPEVMYFLLFIHRSTYLARV